MGVPRGHVPLLYRLQDAGRRGIIFLAQSHPAPLRQDHVWYHFFHLRRVLVAVLVAVVVVLGGGGGGGQEKYIFDRCIITTSLVSDWLKKCSRKEWVRYVCSLYWLGKTPDIDAAVRSL